MLSLPKYGWCKLKIGYFTGTPSYVTDVPTDLLTAFVDYYEKGVGAVFFDEEGTEFNLLLSNYTIFVVYIDKECKTILYEFPDINIDDLAMELIDDIRSNIYTWSYFDASVSSEDEQVQKQTILENLLIKLSELIKN